VRYSEARRIKHELAATKRPATSAAKTATSAFAMLSYSAQAGQPHPSIWIPLQPSLEFVELGPFRIAFGVFNSTSLVFVVSDKRL